MPEGQTAAGADPRSAYLQQVLQQMGQRPVGSGMDLDARLLAEALDRYGQQQIARGQAGAQPDPTKATP